MSESENILWSESQTGDSENRINKKTKISIRKRLHFASNENTENDYLKQQESDYEGDENAEMEDDEDEEEKEKCLPVEEEEIEETVEKEEGDTQITEDTLLSPDNPVLEKFQKALKEHLLKQIDLIEAEIFDLESGAKKINAEKEQLSLDAYDIQQNVNKQLNKINTCDEQLQNVIKVNVQLEQELQNLLNEHKVFKGEMYEAEREDVVLTKEAETVNLLFQQMSIWLEQLESELVVNQRIYEKGEKAKLEASTLKREQDAFIYKIMKEIWKLEGEIETMDIQMKVKEEEREKLANDIAMVNVSLETFHGEHKCLMKSWNSLLVAIAYRDKLFSEMDNNLDKKNERLRAILSEIEAVKKLIIKEMQRNEELSIFKERVLQVLQSYTKRFVTEYDKKTELDEKLAETQRIIEQTNYDIFVVKSQNAEQEKIEFILQRDIQELDFEKGEINNQILTCLEDQVTNDKSSKYLKILVRDCKEKNKSLEITLATSQNLNSKKNMEIESTKFLIEIAQQELIELSKQEKVIEEETDEHKEQIRGYQKEMLMKGRTITVLKKKIDIIVKKSGGLEISPVQLKVISLEKSLKDIRQEIKKLENFWLREQNFAVNLTQQRQKQMRDLNIMKKQIVLLDQKNLKIGDELNGFRRKTELLEKNSSKMLNQLTVLNETISKLRGTTENMNLALVSKKDDYLEILENAEMDFLNLEQECLDIEQDRQNLSDELIEVNRNHLAWERKLMMILELKKQIKDEQSESGEIGTMKLGIHRMQVRLSQLKKAQDKFLRDLQQCLIRREAVVSSTEAREKRNKGAIDRTRINFDKKLLETRNKHVEIQKDIEVITKDLKSAEQEKQVLFNNVLASEKVIEDLKNDIKQYERDIQLTEVELEKIRYVLTIKQKKLGIYIDLLKGKQPYILYNSMKVINPELEKQKELNHILTTIVQKVAAEFPERNEHLSFLNHILTIPLLYL